MVLPWRTPLVAMSAALGATGGLGASAWAGPPARASGVLSRAVAVLISVVPLPWSVAGERPRVVPWKGFWGACCARRLCLTGRGA